MLSSANSIVCILFVSCLALVQAMPNVTCAATHECAQIPSIMTVIPIFTSSTSMLDEALTSRPLHFLDRPSMRPAEFPSFAASNDGMKNNLLTSSASVEGFLSSESNLDLGMF